MRDVATHVAGVGLDADRIEAHARERLRVRAMLRPVLLVEALPVPVDRVRVLHHELAHAQQASARTLLVAPLLLEVVDHRRQLPVREDLVPRVMHHEFLVCVADHVVASVVILRAE